MTVEITAVDDVAIQDLGNAFVDLGNDFYSKATGFTTTMNGVDWSGNARQSAIKGWSSLETTAKTVANELIAVGQAIQEYAAAVRKARDDEYKARTAEIVLGIVSVLLIPVSFAVGPALSMAARLLGQLTGLLMRMATTGEAITAAAFETTLTGASRITAVAAEAFADVALNAGFNLYTSLSSQAITYAAVGLDWDESKIDWVSEAINMGMALGAVGIHLSEYLASPRMVRPSAGPVDVPEVSTPRVSVPEKVPGIDLPKLSLESPNVDGGLSVVERPAALNVDDVPPVRPSSRPDAVAAEQGDGLPEFPAVPRDAPGGGDAELERRLAALNGTGERSPGLVQMELESRLEQLRPGPPLDAGAGEPPAGRAGAVAKSWHVELERLPRVPEHVPGDLLNRAIAADRLEHLERQLDLARAEHEAPSPGPSMAELQARLDRLHVADDAFVPGIPDRVVPPGPVKADVAPGARELSARLKELRESADRVGFPEADLRALTRDVRTALRENRLGDAARSLNLLHDGIDRLAIGRRLESFREHIDAGHSKVAPLGVDKVTWLDQAVEIERAAAAGHTEELHERLNAFEDRLADELGAQKLYDRMPPGPRDDLPGGDGHAPDFAGPDGRASGAGELDDGELGDGELGAPVSGSEDSSGHIKMDDTELQARLDRLRAGAQPSREFVEAELRRGFADLRRRDDAPELRSGDSDVLDLPDVPATDPELETWAEAARKSSAETAGMTEAELAGWTAKFRDVDGPSAHWDVQNNFDRRIAELERPLRMSELRDGSSPLPADERQVWRDALVNAGDDQQRIDIVLSEYRHRVAEYHARDIADINAAVLSADHLRPLDSRLKEALKGLPAKLRNDNAAHFTTLSDRLERLRGPESPYPGEVPATERFDHASDSVGADDLVFPEIPRHPIDAPEDLPGPWSGGVAKGPSGPRAGDTPEDLSGPRSGPDAPVSAAGGPPAQSLQPATSPRALDEQMVDPSRMVYPEAGSTPARGLLGGSPRKQQPVAHLGPEPAAGAAEPLSVRQLLERTGDGRRFGTDGAAPRMLADPPDDEDPDLLEPPTIETTKFTVDLRLAQAIDDPADGLFSGNDLGISAARASGDRMATQYLDRQERHTVAFTLERAYLERALTDRSVTDAVNYLTSDIRQSQNYRPGSDARGYFDNLVERADALAGELTAAPLQVPPRLTIESWNGKLHDLIRLRMQIQQMSGTGAFRHGKAVGRDEAGAMRWLFDLDAKAAAGTLLTPGDVAKARNEAAKLVDLGPSVLAAPVLAHAVQHWEHAIATVFPSLHDALRRPAAVGAAPLPSTIFDDVLDCPYTPMSLGIRTQMTVRAVVEAHPDAAVAPPARSQVPAYNQMEAAPVGLRSTFTVHVNVRLAPRGTVFGRPQLYDGPPHVRRARAERAEIIGLEASKGRSETKFGLEQKSHTVPWSLLREVLESMSGYTVQDVLIWVAAELAHLVEDVDPRAKPGTVQARIELLESAQRLLMTAYDAVLSAPEWNAVVGELLRLYVMAHQVSGSTTHAAPTDVGNRPSSHGEATHLDSLRSHEQVLADGAGNRVDQARLASAFDGLFDVYARGDALLTTVQLARATRFYLRALAQAYPQTTADQWPVIANRVFGRPVADRFDPTGPGDRPLSGRATIGEVLVITPADQATLGSALLALDACIELHKWPDILEARLRAGGVVAPNEVENFGRALQAAFAAMLPAAPAPPAVPPALNDRQMLGAVEEFARQFTISYPVLAATRLDARVGAVLLDTAFPGGGPIRGRLAFQGLPAHTVADVTRVIAATYHLGLARTASAAGDGREALNALKTAFGEVLAVAAGAGGNAAWAARRFLDGAGFAGRDDFDAMLARAVLEAPLGGLPSATRTRVLSLGAYIRNIESLRQFAPIPMDRLGGYLDEAERAIREGRARGPAADPDLCTRLDAAAALDDDSTAARATSPELDLHGSHAWWESLRDTAPVYPRDPVWVDPRNQIVVRGGFDLRRMGDRETSVSELTVRIALEPGEGATESDLTQVRRDVEHGVDAVFNAPAYRLRTGPAGDLLRVRLEFDTPEAHLRVRVHPSGSRVPMDQVNWVAGQRPVGYAHEVGHQLGLRDEYADPGLDHDAQLGRPGSVNIPGSLMGALASPAPPGLAYGGLRGRYLDLIGTIIGADVPVHTQAAAPVATAPHTDDAATGSSVHDETQPPIDTDAHHASEFSATALAPDGHRPRILDGSAGKTTTDDKPDANTEVHDKKRKRPDDAHDVVFDRLRPSSAPHGRREDILARAVRPGESAALARAASLAPPWTRTPDQVSTGMLAWAQRESTTRAGSSATQEDCLPLQMAGFLQGYGRVANRAVDDSLLLTRATPAEFAASLAGRLAPQPAVAGLLESVRRAGPGSTAYLWTSPPGRLQHGMALHFDALSGQLMWVDPQVPPGVWPVDVADSVSGGAGVPLVDVAAVVVGPQGWVGHRPVATASPATADRAGAPGRPDPTGGEPVTGTDTVPVEAETSVREAALAGGSSEIGSCQDVRAQVLGSTTVRPAPSNLGIVPVAEADRPFAALVEQVLAPPVSVAGGGLAWVQRLIGELRGLPYQGSGEQTAEPAVLAVQLGGTLTGTPSPDVAKAALAAAGPGSIGVVLGDWAGRPQPVLMLRRMADGSVAAVDPQAGPGARIRPFGAAAVEPWPADARTVVLRLAGVPADPTVVGETVTNGAFANLVRGVFEEVGPDNYLELMAQRIVDSLPLTFLVNMILPEREVGRIPEVIRSVTAGLSKRWAGRVAFVLGVNLVMADGQAPARLVAALGRARQLIASEPDPIAVVGVALPRGEAFPYGGVRNAVVDSTATVQAIQALAHDSYPYVSFQDFDTGSRMTHAGGHVFDFVDSRLAGTECLEPERPMMVAGGYRVDDRAVLLTRTRERLDRLRDGGGISDPAWQRALDRLEEPGFMANFEVLVMEDMRTRTRLAANHALLPYAPEPNLFIDGLLLLGDAQVRFGSGAAEFTRMGNRLNEAAARELTSHHANANRGAGPETIRADAENQRHPQRGRVFVVEFVDGAIGTDLSRLAQAVALGEQLPQSHILPGTVINRLFTRDRLDGRESASFSGFRSAARFLPPELHTPGARPTDVDRAWLADLEQQHRDMLGVTKKLTKAVSAELDDLPGVTAGIHPDFQLYVAHNAAMSDLGSWLAQLLDGANAAAEGYGVEVPIRADSLYAALAVSRGRNPVELRSQTLRLPSGARGRQLRIRRDDAEALIEGMLDQARTHPFGVGHFMVAAIQQEPSVGQRSAGPETRQSTDVGTSMTAEADSRELRQIRNALDFVARLAATHLGATVALREGGQVRLLAPYYRDTGEQIRLVVEFDGYRPVVRLDPAVDSEVRTTASDAAASEEEDDGLAGLFFDDPVFEEDPAPTDS